MGFRIYQTPDRGYELFFLFALALLRQLVCQSLLPVGPDTLANAHAVLASPGALESPTHCSAKRCRKRLRCVGEDAGVNHALLYQTLSQTPALCWRSTHCSAKRCRKRLRCVGEDAGVNHALLYQRAWHLLVKSLCPLSEGLAPAC